MKDIIAYGGGGKGGGSSRQPVEHPDNLRSIARARVLLLMSEGPIQGAATGNGNFLKSIYLNGTQAQNEDGSLNFPDIGLGYTLGTQDQNYIKGFPASENTVNVGVPLQAGRPWTQQITNSQLSAVVVNVGVNQLVQVNEENMDRTGTVVNYRVQLQVGTGAFTDVVAGGFSFDGKTTTGYERSHRINLPPATRWAIRVIRDTPDSTSDTLQNATYIGSYVEVIDAKLRYPMSALVGISIDAEHFSGGVPTVAFRGKGRIVSVPDNYNPETRTYSGVWSGGFKNAWTNNPAWIFYDLVTNDRYGLGRRITRAQIDRYTLYQIGRYCDEMVPDGFGGTEPRFTCNVYIQKASDALRVISDLASIFRGMSYWAAGLVRVSADIPSDPVHSFTNANVKDGAFVRTSSGLRQRYSVAAVSYNDMTDFGRQKVEFVQDDSAVARYGIRELQVTAFGCTSRGQAHRVGKYALVTAKVETGGIKFTVGLEQMKIQPSDVIRVHDQHRAGRRQAGRIKERVSANSLIVDDAGGARVGDTIFIDDYSANINAINGNTISVSAALPTDIAQKVWAVESSNLKPELFRVISIKEISGNGIEYEIEAVEHNPSKYSAVDYGTKLESFPTTVIPSRAQDAPRNVKISSYFVIREGVSSHTLRITFDKPKGAVSYEVQFRRNNSEWVNLPTTSSNSVEVDNVYAGSYEARVRAINSLDVPSLWAYSEITQIDGLTGEPPSLRTLTTESIPWGIVLRWSFYSGANTIERTQLRYSTTPNFTDSQLLGDYAYPTNMYAHDNLRAGAELWYWGRVADKNGVYGPWLPLESEEGVYGVTSLDAEEYNEIITKEIVESALGQQLMEDIQSIPDIKDQLADFGVDLDQIGVDLDAIGGRFDATDAAIASIESQVAELIGTEEWSAENAYLSGTLVQFDGALYRAQKDVPAGTPVSNTEFWIKVGDFSSLSEAVTALLARMNVAETKIDSITGQITAHAQQLTTLASEVQSLDGQVQGNATAIDRIETEVTELDGVVTSISERETLLVASVRDIDDGNGALADVLNEHDSRAWIRENQTAIATNEQAIARVELELGAQIGENRSYISQAFEAIAGLDEAQSTITTELWSAVGDNQAAIQNTNQTIADNQSAQAAINDQLSSRIDDADSGNSANANAISALNTSVSNLDGRLTAQAQSINQIESNVGSVSASVQDLSRTVTTIDGKIQATRTIKVAVNSGGTQYLAGIGVGVDNTTGGMQSQVVVVADRFSVMHTINGSPKAVFSVQGGVAFINDAMIRNASITTAKIADGAITNAKIANAQITAAKIGTAEIDTLRIKGNAVTTLASNAAGDRLNYAGVEQPVLSVTFNGSASPCIVNVSLDNFGLLNRVYIYRNGSLIAQRIGGNNWGAFAMSVHTATVNGSNTFTVAIDGKKYNATGDDSINYLTGRSIGVFEARR